MLPFADSKLSALYPEPNLFEGDFLARTFDSVKSIKSGGREGVVGGFCSCKTMYGTG